MKMNVELLLQVKAQILAEPKAYEQGLWLETWPSDNFSTFRTAQEVPECGTIGCIAGFACKIAGRMVPPSPDSRSLRLYSFNYRYAAQELLGLSTEQAYMLFSSEFVDWTPEEVGEKFRLANSRYFNWPQRFVQKYVDANTKRDFAAMAQVAATVIDDFIATDGWQREAINA